MAQQLSTNTFGVASLVVCPDKTQGTHTTISAAMAAAIPPEVIWIRSGNYVENITAIDGITLQAITSNSSSGVVVTGQFIQTAGHFTMQGITFNATGVPAIDISGTAQQTLDADNCVFANTGATTLSITNTNASSNTAFTNCAFGSDVSNPVFAYAGSSSSFLSFVGTSLSTASASNPAIINNHTSGQLVMSGGCTIIGFTTVNGGGAFFFIEQTKIVANASIPFTVTSCVAGSAIRNCYFSGPSGSLVFNSTAANVSVQECVMNCAVSPAVTGTGTLQYSLVSAAQTATTSVFAGTLTVVPLTVKLGNATNFTSISVADSPYTVLSVDDYISVDTSGGAVSLLFPNTPVVGQVWVVKDATGSATTNNIFISTVGGTDTIDGATTYVMNTNYQAVNLIGGSATTYQVY